MESKKRYSLWWWIVNMILFSVTILMVVALLLTFLAGFVTPERVPFFTLFALAAPVIYFLSIILLLYWVVKWRPIWMLIILAPLLLSINSILSVYQPSISQDYISDGRSNIDIITYNVRGFVNYNLPNNLVMKDMLNSIIQYKPDILCLQEFQTSPQSKKGEINRVLKDLKYNCVAYSLKSSTGGLGTAIYTKYKIVKSGEIRIDDSDNISIWADLLVGRGDTIRVFNCHLCSTTISKDDRKYIEEIDLNKKRSFKSQFNIITNKLITTSGARAIQVDQIAELVSKSPYPTIVCGDFNDPPASYSYRKIKGDLIDSFSEKGKGISSTYKGFFNLLRIDYVFHSDEYVTDQYSVSSSLYSDHNPVVVSIKKREQ